MKGSGGESKFCCVGVEVTRLKFFKKLPFENEPPYVGSYETGNKKPLPVLPEGAEGSKSD